MSAPSLQGRSVGILVADGSNGERINKLKKAAEAAGARVKIVAPFLIVKLSDGKVLEVDGQLAGTPSIEFDAIASVLDPAQAKVLARDADARDWFTDAFRHLKAIAACTGTQAILDAASIVRDDGVVRPEDINEFVTKAKSRQWLRETTLSPIAP